MDASRMDLVCSRVYDFIRTRAGWQKNGRVHVDIEEVVCTLRDRYPCDRRPSFGEVNQALRILKLRGLISGHKGRWQVCQRAGGTGTKCTRVQT